MPSAKNSIVIARPLEEVFAFFSDCENDPKWRPAVLSIRREGAYGKGAVYRQMIKGPFGRAMSSDFMITEFDENRGFAFTAISGPVRPHGVWTFAPTPDGTQVTFEIRADLRGVKALLFGRPVQRTMNWEVGGFERAKELLEAR